MGRRCKLDGIEVRVVIGDELPDYEFRALQEIIMKVGQAQGSSTGKRGTGRSLLNSLGRTVHSNQPKILID